MKRPASAEALSIQETLQRFRWVKRKWVRRRDNTHVIIRTYPRFSPNPEDPNYEQYCRIKFLLHHPFRDIDSVQFVDGEEREWAELYAACRTAENGHNHGNDTLRCWEDERRRATVPDEEEDEDVVNEDIQEMDEADWQVYSRLHPNGNMPVFGFDDLGRRPIDESWDVDVARSRWPNVHCMATYLQEQKRTYTAPDEDDLAHSEFNLESLAEEQRRIFDIYVDTYQKILRREVVSPQYFNIDGSAGSGKTFLIRAICQTLRRLARQHNEANPIIVLAPSGVAALNGGGQTIHSALALPIMGPFLPLRSSRLNTKQQD